MRSPPSGATRSRGDVLCRLLFPPQPVEGDGEDDDPADVDPLHPGWASPVFVQPLATMLMSIVPTRLPKHRSPLPRRGLRRR